MVRGWHAQSEGGIGREGMPCEASPQQRVPTISAGWYLWLKTGLEWTVSLMLLVVAAPILAALAILIKCASEGPVFYSQLRLGRSGKPFWIYKLRTMAHDCEAITGPVWSLADDPRATKIGRWLRDTHLDELPQLWNVLRGEMALIGPRPERPEIADNIERALPEFRHRLLVRPGITGLAQMRLQADSDLDTVRQKLMHDIQYVLNIGPALDARIAMSTLLHSIGWAATTASRRLVQPFAPQGVVETRRATSAPERPWPSFRLDTFRSDAERDDISRAA